MPSNARQGKLLGLGFDSIRKSIKTDKVMVKNLYKWRSFLLLGCCIVRLSISGLVASASMRVLAMRELCCLLVGTTVLIAAGCSTVSLRPSDAAADLLRPPDFFSSVGETDGEVSQRLGQASALIENGEMERARTELQAVLSLAPENMWALLYLGIVEHQSGNLAHARKLFVKSAAQPQAISTPADRATDSFRTQSLFELASQSIRMVDNEIFQRYWSQQNEIFRMPESIAEMAEPKVEGRKEMGGATAQTTSQESFVRGVVDSWRRCWEERDFACYLRHYAPRFAPPGSSHADWLTVRRRRLQNAREIILKINHLKFATLSPQRVRVAFSQSYRSAAVVSTGCKMLTVQEHEGRWLIVKEDFVESSIPSDCSK